MRTYRAVGPSFLGGKPTGKTVVYSFSDNLGWVLSELYHLVGAYATATNQVATNVKKAYTFAFPDGVTFYLETATSA